MRNRRKRLLLVLLPLLALATGGAVFLASNTVGPTYVGVSTFKIHCAGTPAPICTTTAAPQSP